MEATAAPQIPANLVQFPGGPVLTVPQPSLQAARTSMDAASRGSVAHRADRAQGQSGTSKCPTFAYRKPKTIEANILQGGRATGLYPLHLLAPVPDTMDPRLSALDKLGDLHLTIKGVIEQEPEEPHIAPDVLLALCHHIAISPMWRCRASLPSPTRRDSRA